jgi:hypothetical protein
VKAINSALRKARIDPAAEDASERSREVLTAVLENERLVEMYLRQLWQVGRAGRYLKFPSSVLARNGQTIRQIEASIREEKEASRLRACNTQTAQGQQPTNEGISR